MVSQMCWFNAVNQISSGTIYQSEMISNVIWVCFQMLYSLDFLPLLTTGHERKVRKIKLMTSLTKAEDVGIFFSDFPNNKTHPQNIKHLSGWGKKEKNVFIYLF